MKIKVYNQFVAKRKVNSLYRHLKYTGKDTIKPLIDFASNNYLGLARNLQISEAGNQASIKYGVGAGASRFVMSNQDFFMQIEHRLAQFKKREAAFFGVSGYQINMSVIPALLNKDLFDKPPLVIFDKANHASMYQAVQLAGTQIVRFKHNDFNHLEDLLKNYAPSKRQIFIMTESVYSMDGDICDLASLVSLAQKYNAITLVDDAHSTGVMGENGAGLASQYPEIDIIIGTASKALGLQGGYVACSKAFMDYLYNAASGFIYSTAVSPFIWGALDKVIDLLPNMEIQRIDVATKADYLRQKLSAINISTLQSTTHIVPAILSDNETALRLEHILHQNGFFTKAIRSPTVPFSLPRLRLTVNPTITMAMIDKLTTIINDNK
ncbi:MAG: 8-amino-7-oxononanoate synthase [Alphaproteobacteria bacterium]|jgi:8-amino-7-oxononanoate synthase